MLGRVKTQKDKSKEVEVPIVTTTSSHKEDEVLTIVIIDGELAKKIEVQEADVTMQSIKIKLDLSGSSSYNKKVNTLDIIEEEIVAKLGDKDVEVIQGPIDVTKMSPSELMKMSEILKLEDTRDKLRDKKKKEQVLLSSRDILADLVSKADYDPNATSIEKIDNLINSISEEVSSFEEAIENRVQMNYEK